MLTLLYFEWFFVFNFSVFWGADNLIEISPFISLSVCFCRSWKDLTQPRLRHVLVTLWPGYRLTNQKISCKCFGAVGKRMLLSVLSTTIRYTHFYWLIYKLKRSRQEVTRTCLKRGCVRSFHERQKQTESEMKGLILIRLTSNHRVVFLTDHVWKHDQWKILD